MTPDERAKALERAAAPALAAIEEDKGRAPKWLRPLFDAAAELLFDADLSLERIQEAAGFADPEVWSALQDEVGRPPWTYLRDARLETAAHLLLETDISISEIGRLVGYTSTSSFRQPLRSFLGMPASQYRRQAPRILARAGPLPAGADTDAYWERVLAGELSDAEARELDDYLARLAPGSEPPPAAAETDRDRSARLLRTMAEGIAEVLVATVPETGERDAVPQGMEQGLELPFADQRRLVREAIWFPDATLFDVFSQQSSEADPDRGVELALLAIDSLAANGMLDTHPAHAALAWTRLARARWRGGDPAAAEQDLERAAAVALAAEDGELPAAWEAERRRVEVAFHWLRGRWLQGLDVAAHMVSEHRAAASGGGARTPADPTSSAALARALLLRSEVRAAAAELEPSLAEDRTRVFRGALADVEEVYGLHAAAADDLLPRRLRQDAAGLWARLLVAAGSRGERVAGLAQVRRATADLGQDAAPLLRWLEGHCSADAEPLWREARQGFTEIGDELWDARAILDLARLCLADGRPGEAAALASELASILGAAAASPEDLAAIRPLGRAAPFAEITGDDLAGAEAVLARLDWQQRTRWALDLAM